MSSAQEIVEAVYARLTASQGTDTLYGKLGGRIYHILQDVPQRLRHSEWLIDPHQLLSNLRGNH